eukprot:2527807-Pyramimonas_sp.AAC.1
MALAFSISYFIHTVCYLSPLSRSRVLRAARAPSACAPRVPPPAPRASATCLSRAPSSREP